LLVISFLLQVDTISAWYRVLVIPRSRIDGNAGACKKVLWFREVRAAVLQEIFWVVSKGRVKESGFGDTLQEYFVKQRKLNMSLAFPIAGEKAAKFKRPKNICSA
jgi:hypothetical protein